MIAAIGGMLLFLQYASDVGTTGQLRGAVGLVILIFFVLLPGALLYRWGRGAYLPPPSAARQVWGVYPPKTAAEMGHVIRMDENPRG